MNLQRLDSVAFAALRQRCCCNGYFRFQQQTHTATPVRLSGQGLLCWAKGIPIETTTTHNWVLRNFRTALLTCICAPVHRWLNSRSALHRDHSRRQTATKFPAQADGSDRSDPTTVNSILVWILALVRTRKTGSADFLTCHHK